MESNSQVLDNLARVELELEKACAGAGRSRSEVQLLAVSKFHPASDVATAATANQRCFGENYVQEALEKKAELASNWPDLRWHMIGHVQTRKAGLVAGAFDLVHTLDSIRLADAMEKKLVQPDLIQPVLIEVNIGDEDQKSGVAKKDLQALALHVKEKCPHLSLRGLMCMPPVFDDGEKSRPYFALLRKLRNELSSGMDMPLPELSMGMSGDFKEAIEEGATIVRIGTAIFGSRPPRL